MPTNRRRRTRELTTHDGLSADALASFCDGPFFGGEDFEAATTEAERRALWREHKSALMNRFMAELRQKGPAWAGVRPSVFWEWDEREPQRATPPGEFSNQRVWDHSRKLYDWVETGLDYLVR